MTPEPHEANLPRTGSRSAQTRCVSGPSVVIGLVPGVSCDFSALSAPRTGYPIPRALCEVSPVMTEEPS
uniref:Uncharacterized protein n=1 Tax=Hyaloperonospora arabidopsidis (strain Emoy2) TaxID=559515 RepID=M4C604_HYAAE